MRLLLAASIVAFVSSSGTGEKDDDPVDSIRDLFIQQAEKASKIVSLKAEKNSLASIKPTFDKTGFTEAWNTRMRILDSRLASVEEDIPIEEKSQLVEDTWWRDVEAKAFQRSASLKSD
jgi:hypothetical protein